MSEPEIKRYQPGETIFSEGDPGNCAYILDHGRVEIFLNSGEDKCHLTYLGTGEIFGEMAIIDGAPRSASAIAVEPCELSIINREQIVERIDNSDSVVRLLLLVLLKRIRLTNQNSNANQDGTNTPSSKNKKSYDILKDVTSDVIEKMRLENELKNALNDKEFLLYYQPIVDMNTRLIRGFEALIRWQSPSRGMVRPDLFMGLAEETSLIIPVGRWVLEQASRDMALFQQEIAKHSAEEFDLFISVNISGRQFFDPAFHDHLKKTMAKNNVDHKSIKLEVTEGIFLDGPAVLHAIEKCRDMGFPIALDDFGTGYSSMSYLANFPVDSLKIDQSFIRKMLSDKRTYAITCAMIELSKGLKIPVIAEGIETEDIHAELNKIVCDLGQGYLYAKPLPMDKAIDLLKKDLEKVQSQQSSAS